jgi:hypothetical protein
MRKTLGDNLKKKTMRIKSYYDKIGISSIGAGLDGLFIHSDLTSWMDELAPYLLFIMIKILLIAIGIYLLHLYNKSKTLEEISLNKEDILQNKNLLAKRVSQYHWYLLILLCFLSISMNWGDEQGSGGGIALFILILWLILVWPIIYFWKKRYINPANSIDLNGLTKRDELIKYLFIESNKQYSKVIKFFLLLCIIGPMACAIFPSLIGQTDSAAGFGSCLFFILFITFFLWLTSLFKKRKNNKIRNYYLTNSECKVWASEESENSLHIKFDKKEIEIGKIFLPFSIEDCIQIINNDNYQKQTKLENDKEEIKPEIASKSKYDDVNDSNGANDALVMGEIKDKYISSKTFNLPRLLLFSILFLPLGFGFTFIYAYLMWFNPFPYFNVIATAVLGVLIGFVFPIKLSKCTNTKAAIYSILIFALVCHYFGWVTWMDLYINQSDVIEINHPRSPISSIVLSSSNLDQILYLFTNPSVVFSNISIIAQTGYFSIFSYTPQGFMLYVIWILELLIILYFSTFTSYERSNEPFNTAKNKWLDSFKIQISYISIFDSLKNALINADEKFFEKMTQAEKEESYTEFEVWHLEDEQAYITVKNYKKSIDEKGKIKYDEQELIKYAKIDSEILNVLKIISSPIGV